MLMGAVYLSNSQPSNPTTFQTGQHVHTCTQAPPELPKETTKTLTRQPVDYIEQVGLIHTERA